MTVAEFGEPIYPYLKPMGTVCNAPDSDLWHTLIEADIRKARDHINDKLFVSELQYTTTIGRQKAKMDAYEVERGGRSTEKEREHRPLDTLR